MDESNKVNTNPSTMQNMTPETGSSAGPIIGAIVILAVIVFGALYFLGQREDSAILNEELNSIRMQSDSDEAAAIEADLNATEIENLDAELNAS